MIRQPSKLECEFGECQMVKACFAYDAMKNELPEFTTGCYAFLQPKQEELFQRIQHKQRLIDE